MNYRLILVLSCMILNGGCNLLNNDDTPDGGIAVEIAALGDLGVGADSFSCSKDCYSKLQSKTDTSFVINSEEDYDRLKIRASCLEIISWPTVDFSKKTILAGVIITPSSCCTILREDLSLDPFRSKYTFMVTLMPGTNSTPGAVFFWCTTAKLPADASIDFLHKYNSIN